MEITDSDQISELLVKILDATNSPQSEGFYRKAIRLLGWERVESELGELRYRTKTGEVDNPAKYFTRLLKETMDGAAGGVAGPEAQEQKVPAKVVTEKETYLSPSALELFEELRGSVSAGETPVEETSLPFPYSNKNIPWATFVGPDFFTLSSNTAKSDTVMARFWLMNGKQTNVPLIRGRYSPDGESFGIPTVESGRILGACESIWVDQGCKYVKFEDGSVMCFCRVQLREVARLLGWESFGGTSLKFLKRKILHLKTKPYYLDLSAVEEFQAQGLKGYGFSLVDAIELVDRKKHNRENTVFFMQFSRAYSKQLILRRVVSRPKEMLQMRNELAFLIRLYLEPILISRGSGAEHSIELANLIQVLSLPPAGWHRFKSQRSFVFGKAVSELSGMKTAGGSVMEVTISQGKNVKDFMLVAKLVAAPAESGLLSTVSG